MRRVPLRAVVLMLLTSSVLSVAGLVFIQSAQAQSVPPGTGAIREASAKLNAQQSTGNDLMQGTLQWEAAEKARERLLEAADKEGGGVKPPSVKPPGMKPIIQLPTFPIGQNGNTIKIPTK